MQERAQEYKTEMEKLEPAFAGRLPAAGFPE